MALAGVYLEVDTNQGTWWALGPTISRGVWGHAPQKILNFMGALRCFLMHFGAGILTGITNTTQQKEDYRNSIELSGKTESSCSIVTTEYGISSIIRRAVCQFNLCTRIVNLFG